MSQDSKLCELVNSFLSQYNTEQWLTRPEPGDEGSYEHLVLGSRVYHSDRKQEEPTE
ncbi:hypothetical protein KLEA5_gp37 [Aeromonas phage vB_AveS_KLEA5]|nr:hypothetical protein KLEA5_gp37 [Aeromonas phage vB_AveS_KLEA5]